MDKLGLQPKKAAETNRRLLAYRLISKFLSVHAFGPVEWQVHGHRAYTLETMEGQLRRIGNGIVEDGLLVYRDQLNDGKYWVLTNDGAPAIAVSHDAVVIDLSCRSRTDAMEVFRRNGRRVFPLLDNAMGSYL